MISLLLTVIVTSTSFFDFSFLKLEFLVLRIINIRKVVSEIAFINPLDKTILEEGDMHPHNTFAISMAKCPL